MMKLKHKCLYCQHTTSRMWNLKRHMQSVHGIKKSNSYAKSDDGIPHYQSKYQPSQEEHQYGKRFKDASTQYSENDINHSTTPYLIPSICVCKERKPFIVYNAEVINEKNVQFRKELFQKMGAEIVSIMESNFLPLMK